MMMNKTNLTEEEKLKRLKKISVAAKNEEIKVYAPSCLCSEENDAILTGYRPDQPLSFNITDYHFPGNEDQGGRFPFFKELGASDIGYFLGRKTVEDLQNERGLPIGDCFEKQAGMINSHLKIKFSSQYGTSENSYLAGYRENENVRFYCYHEGRYRPCETEFYALSLDVFSRNSGILETTMMKSMTAVISGCGSVGSYVALELARSGVGSFLLIDNDTLSYSNVCRHQCGISDVGRYKTQAIADRIRLINPEARIGIQTSVIENVSGGIFAQYCGPESLIIGCADNREGDLYACKIAAFYNMPMVSIGFWERAFAGEVFYWIPERSDLACYQCFTQALGDISGRQSVNRRFYTSQIDLSKVNFMPGISVDINFVTNVGIKIILDILNRKNENFVPRLIDSLTQFTLIANTQKQEIGGQQAALFSYPLQVTTSIEVEKRADCKICNKKL